MLIILGLGKSGWLGKWDLYIGLCTYYRLGIYTALCSRHWLAFNLSSFDNLTTPREHQVVDLSPNLEPSPPTPSQLAIHDTHR